MSKPTKEEFAARFASYLKMSDDELFDAFNQEEVNELPEGQQAVIQARYNELLNAKSEKHQRRAHVRFVMREAKLDYDAALASADESAIAYTKKALADAAKAFATEHA
jgi:hypothetical protein